MMVADDNTLLQMTLRRDGQTQEWTITPWADGWSGAFKSPGRVIFRGCRTIGEALALKAEWEAEIAAARADGWS